MIRRTLLAVAVLLAATVLRVGAADPVEINAILSLTGQGTFVGTGQQQALQIAEEAINRAGGIDGRPVKFILKDDQTNPQVAIQLMQGLLAAKATVVLGPSLAGSCNALMPLVQNNGPVLYCLTAGVKPAAGGYVFSTLSSTPDMIGMALGYFRERGWKKIGYIVTTDASGQDAEAGIVGAVTLQQDKGLELVDREHFAPTDLSVAAQVAKLKAAQPDAIVAWVTGTAVGTVLHGIQDAGIDVPIMLSPGNMTAAFVKQYGSVLSDKMYLPITAYYGGTAGIPPATRNAMNAFSGAYRAAGATPDQLAVSAWDPAMLVVDALRRNGVEASTAKIRDYLVNLKGWTGVNGAYDFRAIPQRGVGQESLIMVRWDPAHVNFVPASKAGGKPL
ncbi:MAG: ABC transporter substrate-binding protein [Candidatus Lustribacter sp.]|jgi:branched-chain amino acid transport system substrate-binding protein